MCKAGWGVTSEGPGSGVPGQGHAPHREDRGLFQVIRHLPGCDQWMGS